MTRSLRPERSILDAEGRIDLSGDGRVGAFSEAPLDGSGDAWAKDKHARQTLAPALSPPQVKTGETGVNDRRTLAVPAANTLVDTLEKVGLGDYLGALQDAELEIGVDPNNALAIECADTCRARLTEQYLTKIGSRDHVYQVAVHASEIQWLGLDPQALAVLGQIDGARSVDCSAPAVERSVSDAQNFCRASRCQSDRSGRLDQDML